MSKENRERQAGQAAYDMSEKFGLMQITQRFRLATGA